MSFFEGYLVGINGFFNERAMRGNRDNPGDPAAVVAVPATIAVPSAHFLALLPLPMHLHHDSHSRRGKKIAWNRCPYQQR